MNKISVQLVQRARSVILLSQITVDLILQDSRACLSICVKYLSAL